jgi:hypothetical protein
VDSQGWIASEPELSERGFRCQIVDKTWGTRVTLSVSFMELQAPRIRVSPISQEKFTHYDLSKQDAVINQAKFGRTPAKRNHNLRRVHNLRSECDGGRSHEPVPRRRSRIGESITRQQRCFTSQGGDLDTDA